MAGQDPTLNPDSEVYVAKWYGVRSGKTPGVYTSWQAAQAQVVGFQKPKVKSFATREEAEAFVASGPGIPSCPIPEDRRTRARDSAAAAARRDSGMFNPPTPSPSATANTAKKRKMVPPMKDLESSRGGDAEMAGTTEMDVNGFEIVSGENGDIHRAKKVKPKQPTTTKKSSCLRVYTDGSSLKNGKSDATAGVGVWFGSNDKRYLYPSQ